VRISDRFVVTVAALRTHILAHAATSKSAVKVCALFRL
jgi:hypothetical protein